MSTILQKIINLLESRNIEFNISEHEATISSQDAAKIRNVDLSSGAKSMIVKSKENFYLFVLPGNEKIDWKKARKLINNKDVSLASEEEVLQKTGLIRGSVCPFGNLLNLPTYFDKKILRNETVYFNAGSVNHTISIKTSDLINLAEPNIEDFTAEADS